MCTVQEKAWANGAGYNVYITEELSSFRKDAWKRQIEKHFSSGHKLKVLDAGTGPGFFACILSEQGHDVTGIDFSDGMLHYAKENAKKLNVSPEFVKMDINNITLEDESFDLIVTRNVTWTLPHPEKTYAEFRRLLKPGGMILIYDANWHLHHFDEEKMKRVKAREKKHNEKYGNGRIVSNRNDELFAVSPLIKTIRPDWDQKVLTNLGFDVSIQLDIGQDVYEEWEKELYGESPLFEICAVKKEKSEEENNMHTYWQKRSETFGFVRKKDELDQIGERIQKYLPNRKIKVLDVGTGPGAIAAAVAKLGHEVTAVDLCSNMIKKAKANTEALGLKIDFMCTSAGDLPFEDDTFDAIVSRNLTWALPDPEETFKQWQRVLKPGGMLIYMDANQYYYYHSKCDWENREQFAKINGAYRMEQPGVKYDSTLCDDTAYNLPMSKVDRPYEWDHVVLPQLGFDIVAEEISKPQNKLKYGIAEGFSTRFMIVAMNGKHLKE